MSVAMVGLAVMLVSAPVEADHVRVGTGFLGVSRFEYQGPRLFFQDRGPVDFLAGNDLGRRMGPRRNPDIPRGPGSNRGNDQANNGNRNGRGDGGFFGNGPTVVLPDVAAPPSGGLLGSAGGGAPTSATPEPGTLLLLGAGMGGALLLRRRRAA
ncbi:MAG TPA: PEP-CTERM sorting domain-containing protein [Vicinamibacterales bacterium]|nr:PEP-CTERM sorting domain-containing protein [Vicinamibacterales bacterium]